MIKFVIKGSIALVIGTRTALGPYEAWTGAHYRIH